MSTVLIPYAGASLPSSIASDIIFLRRPRDAMDFETLASFIPTPYLSGKLETRCCQVANKERLQLFCALSSHALTRSPAGRQHEKLMHSHLGNGGVALEIFDATHRSTMQPSTYLLPGTLDGLKKAAASISFYWMPSAANLVGIDGVLGTPDGQVYLIQAAIASEHTNPEKGIRKVWSNINPKIRTGIWNFVLVTDNELDALEYVRLYLEGLHNLTLGEDHVHVQVWGCVLRPY